MFLYKYGKALILGTFWLILSAGSLLDPRAIMDRPAAPGMAAEGHRDPSLIRASDRPVSPSRTLPLSARPS
jgi:hypothetical protein